jgi:hypothetical protein
MVRHAEGLAIDAAESVSLRGQLKDLPTTQSSRVKTEHSPRTLHIGTPHAQVARHHAPCQTSAWEKLDDGGGDSLTPQQLSPHLRLRLARVAGDRDFVDGFSEWPSCRQM